MKRLLAAAAVFGLMPALAGSLIISGDTEKSVSSPKALPPLYGADSPMKAIPGLAAPSAVPLITPAKAALSWEVRSEDLNLANVFARWGRDAGYAVRWDARKNAVVEGPDRIGGSFEDAVTFVLSGPGISSSTYPLEVCFYPNTPPLARITRKGEQDKECK